MSLLLWNLHSERGETINKYLVHCPVAKVPFKKPHQARGVWTMGDAPSDGGIREDYSVEVTLEQPPDQREGGSHGNNSSRESRNIGNFKEVDPPI